MAMKGFSKNSTLMLSAAFTACSGETIMRYLLSDHVRPELEMSAGLARQMDSGKLEQLLAEARGGLVLVLPTDEGWRREINLYDTVAEDSVAASRFRNDLMFAAGAEIDEVGDFDTLLNFASQNDGVIDTAYGTPITVEADGTVCFAEYNENFDLTQTKCTHLLIPPMMFDDGSLYLTKDIILPENLWAEIRDHGVANADN